MTGHKLGQQNNNPREQRGTSHKWSISAHEKLTSVTYVVHSAFNESYHVLGSAPGPGEMLVKKTRLLPPR